MRVGAESEQRFGVALRPLPSSDDTLLIGRVAGGAAAVLGAALAIAFAVTFDGRVAEPTPNPVFPPAPVDA